jgi:two-component system response regulator GlrR
MCEALRQRLEETVIDCADSTSQALLLLREHDYHVVVSDIRMAGLDGLALLNQVRERWPDTPVVLMTAAGLNREAEALKSGSFAFVEKPVDIDRLIPIILVAMEKSLLRRRVEEANRQSIARIEQERRRMGLSLKPDEEDPS